MDQFSTRCRLIVCRWLMYRLLDRRLRFCHRFSQSPSAWSIFLSSWPPISYSSRWTASCTPSSPFCWYSSGLHFLILVNVQMEKWNIIFKLENLCESHLVILLQYSSTPLVCLFIFIPEAPAPVFTHHQLLFVCLLKFWPGCKCVWKDDIYITSFYKKISCACWSRWLACATCGGGSNRSWPLLTMTFIILFISSLYINCHPRWVVPGS